MKRSFLAAVLPLLACLACGHPEDEDKPVTPVVTVEVAKAQLADVLEIVRAPATIFPRQQANIAGRITSPIRELRVQKGALVQKGQLLALLEDRDLAAQRQEAAAALADAKANLEKIENGTLPSDLEKAKGQVETTRAELNQAEKDYERRQHLYAQGAIPQRDFLATQTALATAKANYAVAERSLELLESRTGKLDVQMAQANLAEAEAKLTASNAELSFAELRAPFSGTITDQFEYPGDVAGPASPIYTLMDLSTVVARAQVPETEASTVKLNDSCVFLSADTAQQERGRVTVINRAIDPARRTVEAWCEIGHPPSWLRAGVFGSVRIEVGELPNTVVVPVPAVQVQEGTKSGHVLVIADDQLVHERAVQIGTEFDNKLPIISGIRSGELVVTQGGYGVPDGTKVKIANQLSGNQSK